MTPAMIAAWTAHSRQVFHLDVNLQVLFEMTSVSELTWQDVPWPFDAFALTLDRPLLDEKDGSTFDTILVSRRVYTTIKPNDTPKNLAIMLLDSRLASYPQFSSVKRGRIERLIELKRWDRVNKDLEGLWLTYEPRRIRLPYLEMFCPPQERIVDLLDSLAAQRTAEQLPVHPLSIALRVIVGLSIYLSTLPPRSQNLSWAREEAPRDPEIRSIASGAHVCTVLSSHKLTVEEQLSLESHPGPDRFRQLSPHWRRGHFRREGGQGHNPDAPRCVWVRPALVRKDLLRPGLQVGGAQVDVE
jgi:hypothetical protein